MDYKEKYIKYKSKYLDIVPNEAIGILGENTVENIPVLEGKVIN